MHPDQKPKLGSPFSYLTAEEEKTLFTSFEFKTISGNEFVYVQEISRVKEIIIVTKGSLSFYYDKDEVRHLKGVLKPGLIYGGLSVLYNDHMAIHTLVAAEDTQVISLDPQLFMELCKKNQKFHDYFAKELGRCMVNKTFSDVIARRHRDKALNLPFFNQPVSAIYRPNITACSQDATIREAAKKMSRNNASAILVKSREKQIQGIVTDADLRKRVIAEDLPHTAPVSQITSAPVVSISADVQVFEAFLKMIQEDKRHLAVTGKSGDISGIISEKDLISAQTDSTFLLIKAVKSATSMNDIQNIHDRLEEMLLDPISNGANADYITRLITTFSDAIIDKVIQFSIDETGPVPCKFVFLTMGSEGREEQTLISDQDNAIVFEDIEDEAMAKNAKKYFDRLATAICTRLDQAGYQFCEGNNMAQNPDWCQPLSIWKSYFKKWVRAASPEDLLYSSIFFDFRGTWGDLEIAKQLRTYLFKTIEGWSGFLRNLTENATYFKPPIGLFGKFVLETKGKHKDAFDIKLAMMPIVDFARIHALKNGISQTNTLVRLFRLYTRHALTSKEYTDIFQAYNFLMELRFRRQITTIMDEQSSPDNYIYPTKLSALDQLVLKEIFKMVEKLQQKLTIEFTGVA
ncbi:MAG: DUF294 nucleotidyltransferase-like domain-containing protein [Desulfobacterales bacterium]|nr:DUF294 nucleotidyltransferase-like domain-containing protein [Desulfobacterales bacterium]